MPRPAQRLAHVALLSANPPAANPYIGLLRSGLEAAGVPVMLCTEPGTDGLPEAARGAQVVHLHWLELWSRPAYRGLASLARLGAAGRGLRRLLAPALNGPTVYALRRRRNLRRFLTALTAYKAAGGRLVYTVHNLAPHEGEAAAVEAEGLRRLLTLADAVHVHNDCVAAELSRAWLAGPAAGRPSPPVVAIPHGNYVGAYPNQITRQEARSRLEVSDSAFVYLFLGLIRPYKGLEELAPAFDQLAAHAERDVLLLVAGQSRPAGYAASLLAGPAAANPRLRWHPSFVPDDEIQLWMNAADVAVLPYRQITTSGAALLAFSFGKPVIAPALPAFVELMGDNPALGLLYDPAAPEALLGALHRAQSLGWRADQPAILDWVRQFDWQIIGQRFAALYQQVLVASR